MTTALRERWQYRTTVLVVCMAVYFGARLGQAALATLGPEIVGSLDLTMGLWGLAFTGLSLTSALAQLPSGALSDRYGERRIVLGAVVLTACSTLALAAAPGYAVFLPLMVVVGAGSGLYYSPSTVLLDRVYDGTGRAIGTYRVSGQLAGVAAPLFAGALALRYGWRGALFASGLVLVPVLGGILAFVEPTVPRDPAATLRAHASPRRLAGLLSRPALAGPTALASVVQFVDVASFTFLPAILRQYHGLPASAAGGLYALYFAVVAVVQPVAGWLSDRLGRDAVTAPTLLAGVVGYGLLAREAPLPVLGAAVVLAGVAMTWAAPVQSRLVDALDGTERGVGFGLARTAYLLVGALGSYAVGTLITVAGWATAFGTLAGLLLACLGGLGAGALVRAL